jgi:NAD(P)-dependent dehydrogenase (short-subunit alcohol dehydrogenase family)
MRRSPVWPGEVRIDGHGGADVFEGGTLSRSGLCSTGPPHNAASDPSNSAGPCTLVGLSRGTRAARTPPLSRLTESSDASPNDLATVRRIVDARLWGLTSVVRHAGPLMKQGSITFTSGSLSSRPRPGTAMLTAMRSAVEALAPALALNLAPVRVNAVTPGLIDTPLLYTAYGPERDILRAGPPFCRGDTWAPRTRWRG